MTEELPRWAYFAVPIVAFTVSFWAARILTRSSRE